MCKILGEDYPEYYKFEVRLLTEKEKVSTDHHWNRNDHDLLYSGLKVRFTKVFLVQSKKNKNGKVCSNSNIRKYKNTIFWGSS